MGFFERLGSLRDDKTSTNALEKEPVPVSEGYDDTYEIELPHDLDGEALLDEFVKQSELGQMGQDLPVTISSDSETVVRSILEHRAASPGVSEDKGPQVMTVTVHDIARGEAGSYGTTERDIMPHARSDIGARSGSLEAFLFLIKRYLEGGSAKPLKLDDAGTHNVVFSEATGAMVEAWYDAQSGLVVIEARAAGGEHTFGAGDSPDVRVFGWK